MKFSFKIWPYSKKLVLFFSSLIAFSTTRYASSLLTPNPSVKESPSATIKVCEKQIPENDINPRISSAKLKKKCLNFLRGLD